MTAKSASDYDDERHGTRLRKQLYKKVNKWKYFISLEYDKEHKNCDRSQRRRLSSNEYTDFPYVDYWIITKHISVIGYEGGDWIGLAQARIK
jgi:hypothetical protein